MAFTPTPRDGPMDPANVRFVSLDEPVADDLAWQIHCEGHAVRWYAASETEADIGDGFLGKTDDWRAEPGWADVVVFDDSWVDGSVEPVVINVEHSSRDLSDDSPQRLGRQTDLTAV